MGEHVYVCMRIEEGSIQVTLNCTISIDPLY